MATMVFSQLIWINFSISLLLNIQSAEGVCCQPQDRNVITGAAGTCDDGSLGDICCGVGQCNFFCCACDGGCIMGNPTNIPPGPPPGIAVPTGRKKRWTGGLPVPRKGTMYPREDSFRIMDLDGDGQISWSEAYQILMTGRIGDPILKMSFVPSEFNRLDLNRDGYLSRWEIGAN
ncbi:uncharacterized protein LOC118437814 [Folsomia candida]|uniref:uncharacterized protein LOC118437814 n=1 Tax=Folsomia candida TaxID=158441 RepID=UPI001604CF6C|nr:uncharacterized protein LOC118437814 [Folsomia candida]